MQREQLEHVLRASAAIALEKSFVVIGSEAVLLPFPDAPAELLLSNEVDLYPALHPERAELIEGSIGVLSPFHDTFGYHADGVGPETATMPADWMQLAKLYYIATSATSPSSAPICTTSPSPSALRRETRMPTTCAHCFVIE